MTQEIERTIMQIAETLIKETRVIAHGCQTGISRAEIKTSNG